MRKLILFFIVITLLAVELAQSATITQEQVEFKGKPFPVSELKKRIARQKGLELKPVEPDKLSATIYRPASDEKLPAIIFVHDCRGILGYQQDWAKLVASWGYVVFFMERVYKSGHSINL